MKHLNQTMLTSLCVAMLALTGCKKIEDQPVVATTQVDFNGVWKISAPITALKTVDGKAPPLTAEAQKLYDERIAATAKGDRSWDNTLKCKPPGEPRTLIENSWPFQIGVSDERVVFMFQWNRYVRVVEMGRELPEFDGPFFYGRTSGKWDGNVLVATAIGIREQVSLDSTGLPHSEDMKLTETFRLLDANKLEARIHIDDPVMYTQAWDTVLTFDRQPEDAIVEDNCLDRVNPANYYKPVLEAAKS